MFINEASQPPKIWAYNGKICKVVWNLPNGNPSIFANFKLSNFFFMLLNNADVAILFSQNYASRDCTGDFVSDRKRWNEKSRALVNFWSFFVQSDRRITTLLHLSRGDGNHSRKLIIYRSCDSSPQSGTRSGRERKWPSFENIMRFYKNQLRVVKIFRMQISCNHPIKWSTNPRLGPPCLTYIIAMGF